MHQSLWLKIMHQVAQKELQKSDSQNFTRHARNGILLPKLFWPTVGQNCSSDRGKLLKFKAEGYH